MLSNYSSRFSHAKYIHRCVLCHAEYAPDAFRLRCDVDHSPSLLRTIYTAKKLEVRPDLPGLFQYINWLPVERSLPVEGKPITYESQNLATHLGLQQLFISFNGYWPERDAYVASCSFKELEAAAVLARIPHHYPQTLVIASAGNAGRAFANICSSHHIPLCLVVPLRSLSSIWLKADLDSSVFLIAVDGDYSDAIALSRLIAEMDGFFPEGGAANVARRDGMGLTVIDAAVTLDRIPDHYFQAVGSGTGGIAAWEAAQRLLEDGRFGSYRMKLHLAQNSLFCPMVDAWHAGSRDIPWMNEQLAKDRISQVTSQVLTNRHPAYAIAGGVYDALVDSHGAMYAVSNQAAETARLQFEAIEGIDICPASGVAVAALIQAVEKGTVQPKDCILLNVTSGGLKQIKRYHPIRQLEPNMTFTTQEIAPEIVAERLGKFSSFTLSSIHNLV